ncbi:MAG: hypothetical protein IT513_07765 [Burkholderiales bacterium]|nr:hypothetical protein [Burkholderiales bacterium]
MGAAALDNLVKIGQLKPELSSEAEVGRLLQVARSHLADAQLEKVSLNGRFAGVYSASHAAALAALRWHGYRSENRFTVFQCLAHTVRWEAARWRVLDLAHQKRNRVEYEGVFDVEESMVAELIALAKELIAEVTRLAESGKK